MGSQTETVSLGPLGPTPAVPTPTEEYRRVTELFTEIRANQSAQPRISYQEIHDLMDKKLMVLLDCAIACRDWVEARRLGGAINFGEELSGPVAR